MSDNLYLHSIEDITEHTGLSRKEVDNYYSAIPLLFDGHRQKRPSENNRIYFDNQGLTIFQQIARYKNNGHTPAAIKKILMQDFSQTRGGKRQTPDKRPGNPFGNSDKTGSMNEAITLVNALQEWHKSVSGDDRETMGKQLEVIETQSKTIAEQQKALQEKEKMLLLLTDGRSVEEFQDERERRHQSLKRRQELLEEYDALRGKWFAGKRRREIIEGLKQLQF